MRKCLLGLACMAPCALSADPPDPNAKMCRLGGNDLDGNPQPDCKITGEGCEEKHVTFEALNLTIMKWNKAEKKYDDKPFGQLEAHGLGGTADTWQMYLHGPMMRPWREQGEFSMPPFYVQATWTNQVYRFEQIRKQKGRGKPMTAVQKVVAHAVAPSTSFPVENDEGNLTGMLVAEGQPFFLTAPLDGKHRDWSFGGVDYISDNCTEIFPNEVDTESDMKHGDVVNTVACHPYTGICFFSVWRFFDDQEPLWNNVTKKLMPDCLHYCVVDSSEPGRLDQIKQGCKKGGVVRYETGEKICSKHGVGAVHGFTVAFGKEHTQPDPNEFDIFLVMTGGAQFVGGESSMRKVRCKKNGDGDLVVLKSEVFGRDLFETSVGRTSGFGMAKRDVGGDHAWADESGKYLWVSTFRTPNAGVHMLDYHTGDLIYSVHGTDRWLKGNYAYSAGIHGGGWLGNERGILLLGTSACTHPENFCAPVPYDPITKAMGLEAKGVMYVIDLTTILPPPEEEDVNTTTIVV